MGYAFGLAVPALIVSASYFGNSVGWMLSFLVSDGWCEAPTQGIGIHCFGDFQFNRVVLADESIWNNRYGERIPYLPVAMWPSVAAHWLERLGLGVRGSLIVFLAVLGIAVLTPSIWAAWRLRGKYPAGMVVALAGGMSLPFFIVMDRGNNVGFAVPALLAFFLGLRRGPRWVSPVCFVIAVLLRPQFIVVGLAFLLVRRWRDACYSLVGVTLAIPISFVIWGRSKWFHFMSDWFHNFSTYDQYQSLSKDFPVNLSAARTLVIISKPLNWLDGELGDRVGRFIAAHTSMISVSVVLLVTIAVLYYRDRLPFLVGVVLLLSTSILFPPVEYPYYLVIAPLLMVFFLVPSAFVERSVDQDNLVPHRLRGIWLFTLGMTFVLSMVPVPYAVLKGHQSVGLELAGPAWFGLWLFTLFTLLVGGGIPSGGVRTNGRTRSAITRLIPQGSLRGGGSLTSSRSGRGQ